MAKRQTLAAPKLKIFWISLLFIIVNNFIFSGMCSADPAWQYDGVTVCAAANRQDSPWVIPRNDGKYIFVWRDSRNGSNQGIYAQMIDSQGMLGWVPNNGIAICDISGSVADSMQVVSDNQNGALIFWSDSRTGKPAIYGQKINDSGVQWGANGKLIASDS